MAPFIPNGVYKIRNGEFPGFVADLINGVPNGPICAYEDRSSNRNDKWIITNVGEGGNQVFIESASTPGSFADAQQIQGGSLVGSPSHTIWTIVKVDGGMYYLQSPDATYVWVMPAGVDYEKILLVRHTGQANTKWTFEHHRA